MDAQQTNLINRQKQITELCKENRRYKDMDDIIRQKFGSLEEIETKF